MLLFILLYRVLFSDAELCKDLIDDFLRHIITRNFAQLMKNLGQVNREAVVGEMGPRIAKRLCKMMGCLFTTGCCPADRAGSAGR